VKEETSFDEMSVKQPCGCQSRYLRGTTGLTCLALSTAFGGQSWNSHPSTSNTQLQGVPESMADVGRKTLG